MAVEIISKRCSKCKKFKPISEFHRNRCIKDGHQTRCIICNKKYSQTKKGKAARKHYKKSPKGKVAHNKANNKYQKTPRGKASRKRGDNRFNARHPNYRKATNAVNNAITAGKLLRPDTQPCHYCQKPAQQYHHWHGYEKEHWLDVVPACRPCDRKAHLETLSK